MHVVGKALLLGRLGLFMMLVMAHAQALGQKVIVVDPNDVGLSGVSSSGLVSKEEKPKPSPWTNRAFCGPRQSAQKSERLSLHLDM